MTVSRRLIVLGLGVVLAYYAAERANAADAPPDYPNHAVRIIVPFPAGGTADVLPRIIAQYLGKRWNQPVVVENKTGAGGNIGAAYVATSQADGYTLLASPPGPLAINDSLYKPESLGFKPPDLEPITVLGTVPNVLDVRPGFPAKTAQELIAYAKANPGKVSFASQGNGSTSHLTGILFQKLTGTQMVHVPYRGTTPALQDIMASQVDLFFDNLGSSLSLQGDKLRILATGGSKRNPSLPDVPTLQEAGVASFESSTWFAVAAAYASGYRAVPQQGDISGAGAPRSERAVRQDRRRAGRRKHS
jgi:tripartite-type tricarboxylate transporter receptor subunit TctC